MAFLVVPHRKVSSENLIGYAKSSVSWFVFGIAVWNKGIL